LYKAELGAKQFQYNAKAIISGGKRRKKDPDTFLKELLPGHTSRSCIQRTAGDDQAWGELKIGQTDLTRGRLHQKRGWRMPLDRQRGDPLGNTEYWRRGLGGQKSWGARSSRGQKNSGQSNNRADRSMAGIIKEGGRL